ncbi:MAG: NADP-dependent malic enzyme [Elusimicrobiota bacterium]
MTIRKQDALDYHCLPTYGKIEVRPTKPCRTQRDLSLAYTPGVAYPCLDIKDDPSQAYRYTSKGNLVAVISNGTAVLGLGNIGALAGKPVMEGKGVLFKRFADIDVFDIEIDSEDPEDVIRTCRLLEPTFGGINLEDIKAPECFRIEEALRATMKIPVFHDDQHGTAIISGAGLLNALEIAGKDIGKVKVVVSGAGAAGIACAEHYVQLGAKRENIILCDTKGVIYKGRTSGMNPYKERFAVKTDRRSLAEAMEGADVFLGLSVADAVKPEMLLGMAKNPIIFAMANPDPEIRYDVAVKTRKDVIMATGRSDFPNQVNNVLGFPFIFRGALDVKASCINEQMKVAATHALAKLAKEDVPDSVRNAYGGAPLRFGREYIIPKPFDPRVLVWEAAAVAQAAMETGVAREPVDIEEYKEQLLRRLGRSQEVMREVVLKARCHKKRVVFTEGEEERILRAVNIIIEEDIASPILIGDEENIRRLAADLDVDLGGVEIVDPARAPRLEEYIDAHFQLRQRKGATRMVSTELMRVPNVFGAMMVHMGHADALLSGLTQSYPATIKPALQIIGTRKGIRKVAGTYVVLTKKDIYFIADATVNIDPTAEDLADIAILTADLARRFDVEPRVAMLSFSNFGSTEHPLTRKVVEALAIVKKRQPELVIDGEMRGDTAVMPEILDRSYPFSALKDRPANVLICPDLESANISQKLLRGVAGLECIGPILMGMSKPVHVLDRASEVADIVNMAAMAVVEAQGPERVLGKIQRKTVGGKVAA